MTHAGSQCDLQAPPHAPARRVHPPVASTGYLLAQAGGHARRMFSRVLADFGLSPPHLGVLLALSHLGPTSQQQVSTTIDVDRRNTTPLVDALADRGLIARGADPQDRRRHLLELTPAGRHLLADLLAASDQLDEQLLGGLAAEQRAELHQMLLMVLGPASAWPHPPQPGPATNGPQAGSSRG